MNTGENFSRGTSSPNDERHATNAARSISLRYGGNGSHGEAKKMIASALKMAGGAALILTLMYLA